MDEHTGRLVLQTPRLDLRHLQARDLDALAAMYADSSKLTWPPSTGEPCARTDDTIQP